MKALLFRTLLIGAVLASLAVVTLQAAGITRISFGSSLPGSCVAGNVYIKTSATAGPYWCDGGSWTLIAGGGGGASGALVLLDAQTASSSASLDFTTAIDGTYDHYRFELIQVLPATDATDLYLRVSHDGGMTYDAASNDYYYTVLYFTTALSFGAANHGSFTSTAFDLANGIDTNSGVDAGRLGVTGSVDLYVPAASTAHKLMGDTTWWNNGSVITRQLYSATANQASAVDAVRFVMSSGNIASGDIRLYGIAN